MEIANEGLHSNDESDETTSNDDPESQNIPRSDSEPSSEQSSEQTASEEVNGANIAESLTCTICSSRTFGNRQELLHHLSLTHFNMLLLQRYPLKVNFRDYFIKADEIILVSGWRSVSSRGLPCPAQQQGRSFTPCGKVPRKSSHLSRDSG